MMQKNLFISIFIILLSSSISFSQHVQIIDGWYYIDGEKYFVKGIGYETHTRPGQVPWMYSFDADLLKFDLERIKDAGFNTIRTWGALSEEELEVIENSGLKILFGIWIEPDGDFNNQNFLTSASNHINSVLNYTANKKSIIGYLIMNEPQVQHIYDVGAQSLADLWRSLVDLIHEKHPGIPVSFSNAIIGDYINMELFDFSAYNAYIYNPVTISSSHGYADYLRYLKQNRAVQMPLIITEYGLSVSPGPPNKEFGYGGNSLEQQTAGDLLMYRELIDAGAQGGCVFQYHDGWWKAGNEYSHDSNPEEWFGLIEFSGAEDKYGTPRPVWEAFKTYNTAIITNPKNGCIYQNSVPIEFFSTSEVESYSVSQNDSVLISGTFDDIYYTDELILNLDEEINDVELIFNFFNSNNDMIKSETISILCSKEELELPEISFEVIPANLVPDGRNYLNIHVRTNPLFPIEHDIINYVLHPHIGFNPGIAKSRVMSSTNTNWSYIDCFDIPLETKVATFGAGFTIEYGKFKKRISNQKILMLGDWADPIAAPELISGIKMGREIDNNCEIKLYQNYPNPFNASTMIEFDVPINSHVTIKIYDILGREIETVVDKICHRGSHQAIWDSKNKSQSSVASGVYFVRIQVEDMIQVKKIIQVR
ncbi:T9SS type A sorting domain-containing protein [candidate division KSB1 bacterium]|nr:T9SS type A sorting domain-containing protein [candidate division KSB1 bacterium]